MQILERTQLLRPMPAEVQLSFVHHMFHLKLKTGDPVVWISEKSGDVFILLSGRLEACIPHENSDKVVGIIRPGEVFGEISFITREPRSATVRAIEPSECLVLKGSHLRPVAFNHPALLVMMSTMLATRLRRQNLQ
jgi:CRP-like cAMP-binding protein